MLDRMKIMVTDEDDERVQRPKHIIEDAQRSCSDWLSQCLKLGWKKDQLDALENIWWEHHDRFGNLKKLSEEEIHKQRHEFLHNCLDELVADFIGRTKGLPSKTTCLELMQWSHKETQNPTV